MVGLMSSGFSDVRVETYWDRLLQGLQGLRL